MRDVTGMLNAINHGDPHAADQLLPLVYDELRQLAAQKMAQETPGQTLQATALVHEAYLRLVDGDKAVHWNSRAHFFGAAAQAMRDILVEQARRKAAIKRGGDRGRVGLDPGAADADLPLAIEEPVEDLVALDAALKKLEVEDARKAQLVMLRYFAGLTAAQTAEALGITERTVERDWKFVKAWLRNEMNG